MILLMVWIGYGGMCLNGTCHAADALDTALAWIKQDPVVSIPVLVLAGVVTLLTLTFITIGACLH